MTNIPTQGPDLGDSMVNPGDAPPVDADTNTAADLGSDAPAADAPAADASAVDAPAVDVPASDAPASDAPAADAPAPDATASDAPAPDAGSDAPASDTASDAPASDVPASDAPAPDAPASDAGSDAPASDAGSDAPDAPALDAPDAPAADAPAADAPAADAPASDAPASDAPASGGRNRSRERRRRRNRDRSRNRQRRPDPIVPIPPDLSATREFTGALNEIIPAIGLTALGYADAGPMAVAMAKAMLGRRWADEFARITVHTPRQSTGGPPGTNQPGTGPMESYTALIPAPLISDPRIKPGVTVAVKLTGVDVSDRRRDWYCDDLQVVE